MARKEAKPLNMKASYLFLIYLLSSLSFSASWPTSTSIQDSFLQCLHNPHRTSSSITVYTPKSSSFTSVLHAYERNDRFESPEILTPLAIVTAVQESDVQKTVICSKIHGLLIKIRSGGHDYEGLSYVANVPFIILDMFNLRSISIDIEKETAWVQSGATTGELYYNIVQQSQVHAFPSGVCTTLGLSGHLSGGGYGNMLRKFGLSIDNIVDARIVDSEGRVLDRASMGEDLFWAIRGGGGASFGVVISWKLKLVPVPNIVTVFQVERTLEQGATNLVYKWQHIATKLPNELFLRLQPQVVNGTVRVSFIAMFLGKSQQLIQIMKSWFPELGLKQSDCIEMSWIESTLFWAGFPNGTSTSVLLDRTQNLNVSFKSMSDYVSKPISKQGLETIWKKMIELENVFMQWNPYGGRLSEISVSETPFPHRKALFKIQYLNIWVNKSVEVSKRNVELSRKFFAAMTPFVSKSPREAFLNYRDLDIGSSPYSNATYEEAKVYGTKYFKNNFERLVSVKTKVDPLNFFRNEQSIPPFHG